MMAGRAMMYLRHYKIMAYIGMAITVMAVAALVWWPTMPLTYAIAAAAIIGFGVGTVFPTTTVSIQNAVARHEIGVATGAMNFFRALVSALVVAIMGAILLAGLGVTPERGGVGVGVELTASHAGAAGLDVAEVFRWVFVAALIFSLIAMAAIILMEERPLHGPVVKSPPVVPDAAPAE
jgi:MFS family permease